MTLVRALHVLLQYSSPHKTLSTLVARRGHSQAVSHTERCWMTLTHSFNVFLQQSFTLKIFSTLVARGGQAVSLTERCWMTLSIYWGAQHNLAPVVPPQYTAA